MLHYASVNMYKSCVLEQGDVNATRLDISAHSQTVTSKLAAVPVRHISPFFSGATVDK